MAFEECKSSFAETSEPRRENIDKVWVLQDGSLCWPKPDPIQKTNVRKDRGVVVAWLGL